MKKKSRILSLNIFIIGQFISILGSNIQWAAIPLFILDKTGKTSLLATILGITIIPRVLASPFAGVLSDKLNRKKIMISCDFLSGIITFFLLIILSKDILSIPLFIIVVCLNDIVTAFFSSSTNSLFAELCTPEEVVKYNSLRSTLGSLARVLGPLFGGVLYSIFGIKVTIIINIISFVATAILEMKIYYEPAITKRNINNLNIFENFKEGYLYLKSDNQLKSYIYFLSLIIFFTQGFISIYIPYLLKSLLHISSTVYGLLISFPMLGMVIVSFYMKKLSIDNSKKMFFKGYKLNTVIMFFFIFVTFNNSLIFLVNNNTAKILIISAFLLLIGVSNAFIRISAQVVYQERVKTQYFGRVSSVQGMIQGALYPIGLILCSLFIDNGLIVWYIVFATLSQVILLLFFTKQFKSLFIKEIGNNYSITLT